LLKGLPDRFIRDRLDHLQPDQFVGQQSERPALPSGGRCPAGEGDEVRLGRPVEAPGIDPVRRLAVERRRQPILDKAAANATDGGGMDLDGTGDRDVGPARSALPLVGLEQDAGMGQPPGGGRALADQGAELGAFVLGQDDGIFGVAQAGSPGGIGQAGPDILHRPWPDCTSSLTDY
jgi:hypothetical protein